MPMRWIKLFRVWGLGFRVWTGVPVAMDKSVGCPALEGALRDKENKIGTEKK